MPDHLVIEGVGSNDQFMLKVTYGSITPEQASRYGVLLGELARVLYSAVTGHEATLAHGFHQAPIIKKKKGKK